MFGSTNPRIEEDRLAVLTEHIRQNELSLQEEAEIVEGHIRLLISLVKKWSINSPHLYDVLFADGLFAILQAIRKAPEKLRPEYSLTQYIVVHIKTAFKQAVINQQVVKSANADRKTDRVRGKYTSKKGIRLKRHSLPNESAVREYGSKVNLINREALALVESKFFIRPDSLELREIFNLCVENSFEAAVLKLKKYNYNHKEIAERLNVPRREISVVLHKIRCRLMELL